jgi:hypothetical protein
MCASGVAKADFPLLNVIRGPGRAAVVTIYDSVSKSRTLVNTPTA